MSSHPSTLRKICAGRANRIALVVIGAILSAQPVLAQTVRLHGNVASIAVSALAAPDSNQILELDIRFAPRHVAELNALAAAQQNPNSPEFHHWLTPDEYARRFGPTDQQFNDVKDWLTRSGFAVTGGSPAQGVIKFQGSVATVERELDTHIEAFGAGRAFGNTIEPAIPAQFDGVISAINGLDNLHAAVPMNRDAVLPLSMIGKRTSTATATELESHDRAAAQSSLALAQPSPDAIVGGQGPNFGPSDFYTFYDENPVLNQNISGTGDCIAIIGTSNFPTAPITAFNSQFRLPTSNITTVLADTLNPGIDGDAETEALLDLEWAHAVAPGAPLTLYLGDDANASASGAIVDALATAVLDDSCSVISISFGMCTVGTTVFTTTVGLLVTQAQMQGQTILVSAGDQGAAGLVYDLNTLSCVTGSSRNVNELASNPLITSVGGTSSDPVFDGSGNDVGYSTERVWDDPNDGISSGGATGGGASTAFDKPTYQEGLTPADGQRDQPDVALIASPNFPGSFFYGDSGGGTPALEVIGGTSISTPMWAGIAKLMEQKSGGRLGSMNATIYQIAGAGQAQAGFHDITDGNNNFNGVTGFPAGIGYDQASGWGSVDIGTFVVAYVAAASPTPTATPSGTPTSSSSATPTAAPTSTGTPAPSSTATPGPTPTSAPTGTPTPAPTPAPTPTPRVPSVIKLPTSVHLGAKVGRAKVKVITLTNTAAKKGGATVTVSSVTISGSSEFSASNGCASVAAKRKCKIIVRFAPTADGSANATITVNSNASNGPQTINVTGTGK